MSSNVQQQKPSTWACQCNRLYPSVHGNELCIGAPDFLTKTWPTSALDKLSTVVTSSNDFWEAVQARADRGCCLILSQFNLCRTSFISLIGTKTSWMHCINLPQQWRNCKKKNKTTLLRNRCKKVAKRKGGWWIQGGGEELGNSVGCFVISAAFLFFFSSA